MSNVIVIVIIILNILLKYVLRIINNIIIILVIPFLVMSSSKSAKCQYTGFSWLFSSKKENYLFYSFANKALLNEKWNYAQFMLF